MDEDEAVDDIITPIIPESHWIDRGYSQENARAMRMLQYSILTGAAEVKILMLRMMLSQHGASDGDGPNIRKVIVIQTIASPGGEPLRPDDALLPSWKEFAGALCQLALSKDELSLDLDQFVRLQLAIRNVQLPTEVLSLLKPALEAVPLRVLGLINNGIGCSEARFFSCILDSGSINSIKLVNNNGVGCGVEALAGAVRKKNPSGALSLENCDMGDLLRSNPGLVSGLLSVGVVSLRSNRLGTHAASLVSRCLAANPYVKMLSLDDNTFNDEDAILFADALKSNSNLLTLGLSCNNMTDFGMMKLYKAIYDDESLNAVNDSNHRCQIELFSDDESIPGIDTEVISMNGKLFAVHEVFPEADMIRALGATNDEDGMIATAMLMMEGRKKMKLLHALMGGNSGILEAKYLNEVSLELMPEVLTFLQDAGKIVGAEERNLDRVFQVLRSKPGVVSFGGNSVQRGWANRILATIGGLFVSRFSRIRKATTCFLDSGGKEEDHKDHYVGKKRRLD